MAGKKTKGRDDAKRYYIKSETPVSIRQVAEHYTGEPGCSERNIRKLCTIEGWVQQRDDFWAKARDKSESRAITKASHELDKIDAMQNKAYEDAVALAHTKAGSAVGSFVKLGEYRRKLTGESKDGIQVNIAILDGAVDD